MKTITIQICKIPIALSFYDNELLNIALRRYRVFISRKQPTTRIHVHSVAKSLSSSIEFEPLVKAKDPDTIEIFRWDMSAKINLRKKHNYARLLKRETSLDSFVRILYTFLLWQKNGFLIHSAGIVFDEGLYLFPGVSGTGKSTIARFFDKERVYTDELVGIRKIKKKFIGYATPFWGELVPGDKNRWLPIKKIFFINKTMPEGMVPMAKDEAVIKIMQAILFFADGKLFSEKLLILVKELISSVQTYNFSYDKDKYSFGQLDAIFARAE